MDRTYALTFGLLVCIHPTKGNLGRQLDTTGENSALHSSRMKRFHVPRNPTTQNACVQLLMGFFWPSDNSRCAEKTVRTPWCA